MGSLEASFKAAQHVLVKNVLAPLLCNFHVIAAMFLIQLPGDQQGANDFLASGQAHVLFSLSCLNDRHAKCNVSDTPMCAPSASEHYPLYVDVKFRCLHKQYFLMFIYKVSIYGIMGTQFKLSLKNGILYHHLFLGLYFCFLHYKVIQL